MASKVIRIVCITLLLLVFVAYPIWVLLPREKHAFEIYQATKAATERYQSLQAKANSPETNGYLSPELFKWWAIRERLTPGGPAEKAFYEWNTVYSSAGIGNDVDHAGLLAKRDPDYLKARRELEKYLPEYKRAALAEVFVVPEEGEHPTFADPVMNFIAVRATAQAVSGYVESKAAEGETGQALDALGPVFVLGFNLQGQSSLIQDMIGIAVQAIAFNALVKYISPAQEASSQDWIRFAQTLQRSIPPEGQIVGALEAELMLVDNTLEDVSKGRHRVSELSMDGGGTSFFALPGFLARERRIYHNNMADILEEKRRGKAVDLEALAEEYGFWSVLTGRVGILSQIVIPNTERAEAQMILNRSHVVGGAAVAGILAYREKYGKLPTRLEDLSKVGVELPEVDFLDYQVEGKRAELLVKIPTETLKAIDELGRDSGSKWFKWTPEGGRFSI